MSVRHLSVVRLPVRFSFPDDNLSKHQWIFTKLDMCIDMWRSGLGLLMGKFCQFFTELSVRDTTVVGYYSLTFLFPILLERTRHDPLGLMC